MISAIWNQKAYYSLLLFQLVLVSTMKDKQGKPMPNATPSVPDGSELDVSLYEPEGKFIQI